MGSQSTISNKELQALTESLFSVIDNDRVAYSKSDTAARSDRLQSAVSVLRKLIIRELKNVKFKLVKSCVQFIRNNLFIYNDELCLPIVLDLSRLLLELIQNDAHRDHLSRDDWLQTTSTIIRALKRHELMTHNEKVFSSLMSCLLCMISVPVVMFDELSINVTEFLTYYFNHLGRETNATSIALELVNQTLILYSTSNVGQGFEIIRAVLKVSGQLNRTNFESLHNQLLIFGILASRYIRSDMNLLIDDSGCSVPFVDEDAIENLIYWIDALVVETISSSDTLSLSMIDLTSQKLEDSWFHLDGISLVENAEPVPWFRYVALINLMNAFYTLELPESQDVEEVRKRRKLNTPQSDSYSDLLRYSSSPVQVYRSMVVSPSIDARKAGLQLLLFHINTFDTDHSQLNIHDMMIYETMQLAAYISLLLATMISHGWSIDSEDFSLLLRVNLQMVKEESSMAPACFLLKELLKRPGVVISDKSLNQLIGALFDVSEVYGPAKITNDSIQLWLAIMDHAKFLNTNDRNAGDLVVKWLKAKWYTISAGTDSDQLGSFMLWLCGKDPRFTQRTKVIDNVFSRFNARAAQFGSLPERILGAKLSSEKSYDNFDWISSCPLINLFEFDQIVELMISSIDASDSPTDAHCLVQMIGFATLVYQEIYNVPQLSSNANRLKCSVARAMEGPSLASSTSLDVIREFCHLKVFNNAGIFIFEYLKFEQFAKTGDPDVSISTSNTALDEFSDFTDVRRRQKTTHSYYATYTDLIFAETKEQLIVKMIFMSNAHFDQSLNSTMEQLVSFLDVLDSKKFICAFYTLMNELHGLDRRKVKKTHIGSLLRFCGNKILGVYQTERSHITFMLLFRFCSMFCDALMSRGESGLLLDFADIFNWVLSLGKKRAIYGVLPLATFASLVYEILSHDEALELGDVTMFEDFCLSVFSEKSNFIYVTVCHRLSKYISKSPTPSQLILFNKFVTAFPSPQSSSESAATFSECMVQLGKTSYSTFVYSLDILCSQHQSFHFAKYIGQSIHSLLEDLRVSSARFPDNLVVDLLGLWYDRSQTFMDYPFLLLGYSSFEEFLVKNQYVIYSITKSRRYQCQDTIGLILDVGDFEVEDDLLLYCLGWLIPLAFSKNGARSELMKHIMSNFGELLDHQAVIIVSRLLQFCDSSVESAIFKWIPSAKDGVSSAKDLISPSSTRLYSTIYGVSLSDTIHLIQSVSSKIPEFWTPQVVYHIARNLLRSLQKDCIFNDDKILAIRRLKFLFIISGNSLKTEECVRELVKQLLMFLPIRCIHDDVSNLLLLSLNQISSLSSGLFSSSLYPVALISLFDQAAHLYNGEGFLNSKLYEFLNSVFENIDPKDPWRMLFSIFFDVISGRDLRITQGGLHGLLKYISQLPNKSVEKCLFRAMELLFAKAPEAAYLTGIDVHKDVAELLLKSDYAAHGKDVMAFVGRYLGRYYLKTGDGLMKLRSDFKKSFEYDLVNQCSSLKAILDILQDIQHRTTDLDEVIALQNVFGLIMHQYMKHANSVEPLVDLDEHLTKPAKLLLPLDAFQFKVINPHIYTAPSIEVLLSARGGDCSTWCGSFSACLIHQCLEDYPWLLALQHYVSAFPVSAVRLLNPIWLFTVFTIDGSEQWLNTFVRGSLRMFEHDDSDKEKLAHVTNLFYLVEVASRVHEIFQGVFDRIVNSDDIVPMCKAAISVGFPKFSLLLLETIVMSSDEKQSYHKLVELSGVLKDSYAGLSDSDLLYGIPTDASLKSAVELFGNDGQASLQRLMFASAEFDSSRLTAASTVSRNSLMSTLSANGLSGLADIMNGQSDPSDRLSNSYDWCWKLDEWDLPSPETVASEGQAIYTLLKSLRSQDDSAHTNDLCVDMICSMLRNRNQHTTLLKSLGTLVDIENINKLTTFQLKAQIEEFVSQTEIWFPTVSFEDFEDILLARRTAFKNIPHRIGTTDSTFAVAFEAMRYGHYARLHNENQKAVNSTLFLSHLLDTVTDRNIHDVLAKVSLADTASTLWSQGETVIPIKQLKKCLETKIKLPDTEFPLDEFPLSDSYMNSFLVKWNYEARQKRYEDIVSTYAVNAVTGTLDVTNKAKASILHRVGKFYFKELQATTTEDLTKRHDFLTKKMDELRDLKLTVKDKKVPERERTDAGRFYRRMVLEYNSDKEIYELLLEKRKRCLELSLETMLTVLILSDEFDNEDIDKFCALWLQLSQEDFVNVTVHNFISKVPSFKFISWINQLVSRLSSDSSSFQKILQSLIERICLKHPWHSLTYLINLRVHRLYEHAKTDRTISSRMKAADNLWRRLSRHDADFDRNVLKPLDQFCEESINLATQKVQGKSKRIYLDNLKCGEFWMKVIGDLQLPLPTLNDIPISHSGSYDSIPRITRIEPTLSISPSGISLPKIMTVLLNDGSSHKLLLKGGSDDLRQDAIMQQVFAKVNAILQNENETRRRNLRVRTYKVVPLGPQAGIIEFVADSISLNDVLKMCHQDDTLGFDEARSAMKDVQQRSTRDRVSTYDKLCQQISPRFRKFFVETFLNIDDWYTSRQVYTRGVVTTSMVGHILGLGDRHLNNILIDRKTCEPIHIDLGVAFDQGKLLPVPERVPFRLTRDMVDGLGCTGVEGSFRKGSEHVFRVLRGNSEKIVGILNVLRYDPLYSWAISPVRKKRLQTEESIKSKMSNGIEADGSDAVRALKSVENKLAAHGLSVEATVQELIIEATDVENLAVIYMGWAPFY